MQSFIIKMLSLWSLILFDMTAQASDFVGTGDLFDMAVEMQGEEKAVAFVAIRRTNEPAAALKFEASLADDSSIAFTPTENPGVYEARLSRAALRDALILFDAGDGDTEVIELTDLQDGVPVANGSQTNTPQVNAEQTNKSRELFYGILGFVLGLTFALYRRRRPSLEATKTTVEHSELEKAAHSGNGSVASLLLLAVAISLVSRDGFAHAGHSHAEEGEERGGFGIAEVKISKKSQFVLGVRTFELRSTLEVPIVDRLATLKTRQQSAVSLRSPVQGVFKEGGVRVGAPVKRGQIVAYVDGAARVPITSPINGIIAHFHSVNGEMVAQDDELVHVIDASTLWVEANLRQEDLARVQAGDVLSVTVEGFGTYQAKILEQLFKLDPLTASARVLLELDNHKAGLPIGAAAVVHVPAKKATDEVLVVPHSAVVNLGGATVVFVKTAAESFVHKPVRVGSNHGADGVVIEEGLSEGDLVVTSGSHQLLTASN